MFPLLPFQRSCITGLMLWAACTCSCPATAQTAFVAGLAPYQRPENAPALSEALPETTRAGQATRGIAEPVPPPILSFLKDQGAWYTPFSYPGMTGGYDIRRWHTSPLEPEKR